MFWYNYLLERHLRFDCTQTCRYDAIGRCNPFKQLGNAMLKVFLLITFFSAELRSSQYLLLRWCSRGHDTMQFSVPIFHSHLSTLRLPIYLKMGAYAVCTPSNSLRTYIFARFQCSHSRSYMRSEQHSCRLFQTNAPTHWHSVAPALRHTHAAALMQQHSEDVVRKKEHMCRSRRLQLNNMPAQRSVRRGAEGKVASM